MPVLEPRAVGPGWNARVYAVVRQCPAGFVTTYGQVATLLGSPRVARHVGYALAALAVAHVDEPVPWHRVINSQGRISYRGDVGRGSEQERLLAREGVKLDARGRVDLRRFLYTYPDFRWPEDPVDPDGFEEPAPAKRKAAAKRNASTNRAPATERKATKSSAKRKATEREPTKTATKRKAAKRKTATKRKAPAAR